MLAKPFYRRGEKVSVSEVKGVLAMQQNAGTRGSAAPTGPGTPVAAPRGTAFRTDVLREELDALAATGWTFVKPSARLLAASRSGQPQDAQVQDMGRVFRQPKGHVRLGGRRLVVQLQP